MGDIVYANIRKDISIKLINNPMDRAKKTKTVGKINCNKYMKLPHYLFKAFALGWAHNQ